MGVELTDASAPPRSRIRLTSVAATLAAIVVAGSFFLPWVAVPREEAEHFQAEMTRRLADSAEPLPPGVEAEDWRRLAALAAEQGEVSGIDIFYWARTAHATTLAYERAEAEAEALDPGGLGSEGGAGDVPASSERPLSERLSSTVSRVLLLVAIALAGVSVGGVLVGLALLVGRLHHAPSPVLILALLTGVLAVGIPAAYSIVAPALGFETHPRAGLILLLPAGGVLLLAGVFGVRRRNWWRVLVGTLFTAGLLALLAWGYVASGA